MPREIKIKCDAASPGIAIGKTQILDEEHICIIEKNISKNSIDLEIKRFNEAVSLADKELVNLKKTIAHHISSEKEAIFDAHLMILRDPEIIKKTIREIGAQRKNSDFIYYYLMKDSEDILKNSSDRYLKERAADIRDVKCRVVRKIQGSSDPVKNKSLEKQIVVARTLNPSDAIMLENSRDQGFAIETGGLTSHAIILARSLGIPAVVGAEGILKKTRPGDTVILNGYKGEVIINPREKTIKDYLREKKKYEKLEQRMKLLAELPADTVDGKSIELSVNLDLPLEINSIKTSGGKGIGLYRTEYLYLKKEGQPEEIEQYNDYKNISDAVYPDHVIIRTFDLGGDKMMPGLEVPFEENPFLGWRAVRVALDKPEMLKHQLRAILKASAKKNIKILVPMISNIDEVKKVKKILEQVKIELSAAGIPYDKNIPFGLMIEIPSAAIMAAEFAKEVDFFSIGTNDLIQYTLAVDRRNRQVRSLYQAFHPAVLSLINNTIKAGHDEGIWVGMCGEMAGNPYAVPLLIGLDIDELSVSPVYVLKVKNVIRHFSFREAQKIANKCLKMNSARKIEKYLINITSEIIPELTEKGILEL